MWAFVIPLPLRGLSFFPFRRSAGFWFLLLKIDFFFLGSSNFFPPTFFAIPILADDGLPPPPLFASPPPFFCLATSSLIWSNHRKKRITPSGTQGRIKQPLGLGGARYHRCLPLDLVSSSPSRFCFLRVFCVLPPPPPFFVALPSSPNPLLLPLYDSGVAHGERMTFLYSPRHARSLVVLHAFMECAFFHILSFLQILFGPVQETSSQLLHRAPFFSLRRLSYWATPLFVGCMSVFSLFLPLTRFFPASLLRPFSRISCDPGVIIKCCLWGPDARQLDFLRERLLGHLFFTSLLLFGRLCD